METRTRAPLAEYFKDVKDPRIERKKLYPLNEAIVITIAAFLVHGLMLLCDENVIKARSYFGRRDEFYNALRTFFRAFEFQTWENFLLFVTAHAGGG
ncbi:MAG: transposase family protein [Treponema sp.]|jgi:hypothetical protein|nr:transposase family protein [Treponema sp.]